MPLYSDEDDFESLSEEEEGELPLDGFDDGEEPGDQASNPFAVSVVSNSKPPRNSTQKYGIKRDENSTEDYNLSDSENEMELHGKGERMKLSKKPPEVLLRQYQHKISTCLEEGKVSY